MIIQKLLDNYGEEKSEKEALEILLKSKEKEWDEMKNKQEYE